VRWGVGVLALLVLLSVGWLLYSSLRVRSELQAVRSGVHTMRDDIAAGKIADARATAVAVRGHADNAARLSSGPVWALASDVPALGDPFTTTRALTSSVRLVADGAISPLIDALGTFQSGQLRTKDGTFDLPRIAALAPTVATANSTVDTAIEQLRAASSSTWLGPVNHARDQLISQLSPLSTDLGNIGRAVAVVPTVLGADGPRSYMISFQNDAESRATGGIPGAFAIIRTNHGKVTFTNFEPDNYFGDTRASGLTFGGEFSNLFQTAQEDYRDSNYSPNFPYAAQIWASMWQAKTGEHLDGALIVDPTALSYLLSAHGAGPIHLPDGSVIGAGNVVKLTQQTIYQRYPALSQQTARKNFLLSFAKTVSEKLLSTKVDAGQLVREAATGAAQHRLLFWSRDVNVEKELTDVPLGGVVPTDAKRPYVAVAVDNDSQSKLDYYLHTAMAWQRTGCGPTRHVTVTVTLTNQAPTQLPAYVIGNSFPRRTETLDLYVYGSSGGHFTGATEDDRPVQFGLQGTDLGHPVFGAFVNVPPNGQQTVVQYHFTEPAGVGPVLVREQPMINPMTTTVSDNSCR
jgi:hypothetical protein